MSHPPIMRAIPPLPEQLPLFPLTGAVLLPQGRLPLNIFEPRYKAMVDYVLAQPSRMIGMVQPNISEGDTHPVPAIYKTGCAGRITSMTETEDGRYLIALTGISRFHITQELTPTTPFRVAEVDWTAFHQDLIEQDDGDIDRKHLIEILEVYFKTQGIAADWAAIQGTPSVNLIASLAMICPLPPNEKQALLEAADLHAQADLLMALLKMANHPQSNQEAGFRH